MITTLVLDSDPPYRIPQINDERTQKASATKKLQKELTAQRRMLKLMGKLEWDSSYDYKAER